MTQLRQAMAMQVEDWRVPQRNHPGEPAHRDHLEPEHQRAQRHSGVALVDRSTGDPGPVISSVSPSTVSAGGSDVSIRIDGSGFVANSVVYWNTTALMTSY